MNRTRIHIKAGKIVSGAENLKRMIRLSKDGDFAIEKKTWSGAKTWEQIKTIHGVLIPAYSDYTEYTFSEAKRLVKLEFGEKEHFEKDGETFVELKSFAAYTKAEMRTFIDGFLHHLEFDCNMIIDLETRKKLSLDSETGELVNVS